MSAQFLDDQARAAFERAVTTIEQRSGVELVIALRRRSSRYLHAHVIVGLVVGITSLAIMLFVEHRFSLLAILIDPHLFAIAAGVMTEWLPDVKRVLTLPTARRRSVERAARATFVERGVHNTVDRTGMLVYISWLEREVAVIVDTALEQTFPRIALKRLELSLTAAMRESGVAVARILEELAPQCAAAVPRRIDDVNELPDAVDDELTERPS